MGGAWRADWITELDFEVRVVGRKIGGDVEYLFWVGCAGALEDRAKKTFLGPAQQVVHPGRWRSWRRPMTRSKVVDVAQLLALSNEQDATAADGRAPTTMKRSVSERSRVTKRSVAGELHMADRFINAEE